MFVRLGGIPHVEPFAPHPDEGNFITRALRILVTGDMNPHWFGHPGTLTIYNLSAVFALDAFLRDEPLSSLRALYTHDPVPYHVLGRQLIVFWSIASQLALWFLARAFVPRWPALLAVALLACAPLDVRIAAFIRTDTQQGCLMLICSLLVVRSVRSGSWLSFAGAGLMLGLAVAVKWPSVVLCLTIALAALVGREGEPLWPPSRVRIGKIALAAVVSTISLFAVAPHVFLDFGTVLDNVAREARDYHLSATSPGFFSTLGFYGDLFRANLSIPGLLLAGIGAAAGLRSTRWRETCTISCALLTYLCFIALQKLRWDRWAVPMLPYLCVLAAIGVEHVTTATREWFGRRGALGVSALLTALLALSACSNVGALSRQRAGDPRPVATWWIVENVPRGSKILTETASPLLPKGMYVIFSSSRRGRLERAEPKARFNVPRGALHKLRNLESTLSKVDYVITGNHYGRIKTEPERYQLGIARYEYIHRTTELVKSIGPYEIRKVVKKPKAKKKSKKRSKRDSEKEPSLERRG